LEELWKTLEAWYGRAMDDEAVEALEERMTQLRRAMRQSNNSGDKKRVAELRAELERTNAAWDLLVNAGPATVAPAPDPEAAPDLRTVAGSMVPAREQAHRALTFLGAPAAPKLLVAVHEAFFPGELTAAKLASLRRDEERSYRTSPHSRPYYLCPALTYDLLTPARALLTVSTWPLEQRIVGPLSPRVDFLTCAIKIAEGCQQAGALTSGQTGTAHPAARLLWQFASSIPGAVPVGAEVYRLAAPDPELVITAARAELSLHAEADAAVRADNAGRVRRLPADQQLFGARTLGVAGKARHA
jgi:hypothetical protein